ncbi:Thioredoxin (Trx) [Durusdinium trenchii]|uniref:Thioredoxin (Trx) n=1 Tax=Durusdinium trenchii TaxID=1381693 RepID=A0ABP0JZU8_9DINO
MALVKTISKKTEFDGCLKLEKLVVFYFSASWCQPCHLMAPKYAELANMPEFVNIEFVTVDVDEAEEIADAAGIDAVPTFQIFRGDAQVGEELVGADEVKLKDRLKEVIQQKPGMS